ncbi:N-acetylmuramoyl-L-alanine amidase [Hazenella sp. IB182357]|uniref:N-acetylmuramoyl-L-alanine amidase n=1 Tax=Polycladospora coralii TaxID=2771432 RepID=A0A926NFG8_9BACL|nr:N-acetylmuramoyl-L-alanine amidase [Polycladospora coralii]MBD1372579.1 N-acetylmuramoyl-L-alanine amidase [Polycladospora coralii]
MPLQHLKQLKDHRYRLTHHSRKRYVNKGARSKTHIAIHHSLVRRSQGGANAAAYARYHVNHLGWPGIGYHFVIEADGTIIWCHDLGVKSYHVGNSNGFTLGICLSGDFRYEEPTAAQQESLRSLVAQLKGELPQLRVIKGHNEFPGYSWKQCPVFNYRAALGIKQNEVPRSLVMKSTASPSGKRGHDVKDVQQRLGVQVDGIYGPRTKKAVYHFQRSQGLAVDGIVGPNTSQALQSPRLPRVLRQGMKGSDVAVVQQKLGGMGVDGIYGPQTKQRVMAFQKQHGLTIDGIVGSQTWRKLFA